MARSTAIHDRVAEAILDAAANLLAGDGEPPSMAEVAAAAGVARAPVFRPVSTPEQVVQARSNAAHDATPHQIASAGRSR